MAGGLGDQILNLADRKNRKTGWQDQFTATQVFHVPGRLGWQDVVDCRGRFSGLVCRRHKLHLNFIEEPDSTQSSFASRAEAPFSGKTSPFAISDKAFVQ